MPEVIAHENCIKRFEKYRTTGDLSNKRKIERIEKIKKKQFYSLELLSKRAFTLSWLRYRTIVNGYTKRVINMHIYIMI